MRSAPAQSVGFCSPNGWTDCDLFVKWLQHLVSITNASTDNPQVIILDGHNSHKFLEAITFEVEHGIHLITLPPPLHPHDAALRPHLLQGTESQLQRSGRQLDGVKSRQSYHILPNGRAVWKSMCQEFHTRQGGVWLPHVQVITFGAAHQSLQRAATCHVRTLLPGPEARVSVHGRYYCTIIVLVNLPLCVNRYHYYYIASVDPYNHKIVIIKGYTEGI